MTKSIAPLVAAASIASATNYPEPSRSMFPRDPKLNRFDLRYGRPLSRRDGVFLADHEGVEYHRDVNGTLTRPGRAEEKKWRRAEVHSRRPV